MKICTSQIWRNPKVPKLSFVYRKADTIAWTISPENTVMGGTIQILKVRYYIGPLSLLSIDLKSKRKEK